MADYTDLKARLRAYLPPLGELDGTAEVLGLPAILRDALAAIEELEQRSAAPAPEPVAQDTIPDRLDMYADQSHLGSQMQSDLYAAATHLRKLYAATRPAQADEARILREFCGWLSADIPELHKVEVPRLAESLERFLARTGGKKETK